MKMNQVLKWVYLIAIVTLLMWLAYVVGVSDGRNQVKSVYENVQPVRVLQHLLNVQEDGVLGNETLTAYRAYDREHFGFVEDLLEAK